MIHVYAQAEPFFKSGNNTAVLFIHGFTASPSEVYPVAQIVHENSGATVSSILLPGHGSHPRFLNRTTWQDWYQAVEDEARYLIDNYDKVYIVGLSLGGLLALYLGINLPEIKGVTAINAPIKLRYPIIRGLALGLQWVKPYFPKSEATQADLRKKGRFAYDCTPVKAFLSMMNFRDIVLKNLDKLTVPLLIIQSLADETVDPAGVQVVMDKAKNSLVELVELEDSRHVATMGEDREKVAGLIIDFMKS